jgi:hypothetical protein
MASEPTRDARPGGVPLARVLVVLGLGALLVGGGAVLGLAWWLLEPDGPEATGQEVTGASADAHADDGYTVWSRNDDGLPVRWDPCSPIELVVDPDGAPDGFLEDLELATRRIAAATGLELEVVGTTDERPSASRPPYQPDRYGERWAPVLVAWTTPDDPEVSLRDIDRGVATPIAVGRDGDRTYVTGQVVFNQDRDDLTPGFDDRATSWGSTILHELGHLVGLGHVDDRGELMAVTPGEGPVRFGPGDLRGLAAIGADHGCVDVPRPQPVEVVPPSG